MWEDDLKIDIYDAMVFICHGIDWYPLLGRMEFNG